MATWPLGRPPTICAELPPHMWALALHRGQYGAPGKVLRVEEVARPAIEPEDAAKVLVAVLACGPNFNTNFAALGLPVPVFGRADPSTLHIPGSDALGIVVDAGPAVKHLRLGETVILDSWTGRSIRGYETHDGFNAQFALIEEERAIRAPAPLREWPPVRLAALLLTYGTAYRAVVERLRVQPGDALLVMGGGKGTSFAGAQLGKALGARVILVGSNQALMLGLIDRGMADAYVDRRDLPAAALGPVGADETPEAWGERSEPFRQAVRGANGGELVDKIFEHTGGVNFPALVSALRPGGSLAFFGATGGGVKGEYRHTFVYAGGRYVFDARWVWMRQKQILFRRDSPDAIMSEIGLPPGRKVLVWGADPYAREFVEAALRRHADVAVLASYRREGSGIAELVRSGVKEGSILDRDDFELPSDMPDPLLPEGTQNPDYGERFLKHAQRIGKALWALWGARVSPDLVVERTDQSTMHFSTFLARGFAEDDPLPCGHVVVKGPVDLSIRGSHMYGSPQAREVVRLLAEGDLTMEAEDLEITGLDGLPAIQENMLRGAMSRPKGVAFVQADRHDRSCALYEDLYFGNCLRRPDPERGVFVGLHVSEGVALVTLSRPEALNALNEELVRQLGEIVSELGSTGMLGGMSVKGLILAGQGGAFAAGADVSGFVGRSADEVAGLAGAVNRVFLDMEDLPVPVVAVIDGFALGGGNELAMSAHYRIATRAALFGQPEVKLGIFPGYGGMQRLPRLTGIEFAAGLAVNGEMIDARAALAAGLVDEIHPQATALRRGYELVKQLAAGVPLLWRKDWEALGGGRRAEADLFFAREDVQEILRGSTIAADRALDLRSARMAAAREALAAVDSGLRAGLAAGVERDSAAFGAVVASAAGQEWIRRFLDKDPLQASSLTLLPSRQRGEPVRP